VADDNDAIKHLNSIVNIITPILSDIKTNIESKKNIQVTPENKVKLKEIAKILRTLKQKITALFHSKPTKQTSLNIK
jgi:hypothetical protein